MLTPFSESSASTLVSMMTKAKLSKSSRTSRLSKKNSQQLTALSAKKFPLLYSSIQMIGVSAILQWMTALSRSLRTSLARCKARLIELLWSDNSLLWCDRSSILPPACLSLWISFWTNQTKTWLTHCMAPLRWLRTLTCRQRQCHALTKRQRNFSSRRLKKTTKTSNLSGSVSTRHCHLLLLRNTCARSLTGFFTARLYLRAKSSMLSLPLTKSTPSASSSGLTLPLASTRKRPSETLPWRMTILTMLRTWKRFSTGVCQMPA